MEVKSLGSGAKFARTVNYLGTTGDGTPSHKNPGRTGYLMAKKHGLKKYMDYFSPYLLRDQLTFGNMPCGSKQQIERYEQRLMANHGNRHAKSFEFVLMPSRADKIDPHNSDSMLRFKHYVNDWVDNAFNGRFEKTKQKTRKGHRRYQFVRTPGQEFSYYAVIQCDSHNNSRPHAHIVVLNDNLKTGKALNSNYYGIQHLRRAVNRASADMGFSSATRLKKEHQPSKIEKKIISSAQNIRHNPTITSRPKFIKALAKNGVEAKYRRNKKNPKRSGWKFKLKKHSFIKASRISHAIGGSFLATTSINKTLSDNRKLKARAKKRAKKEHQERQERLQRKREQRREMILNERKIQHDKAVKKHKHIRQARLFNERSHKIAEIQSAIKKSRQVRHERAEAVKQYHKETEIKARPRKATRKKPRFSIIRLKSQFHKIEDGVKEFAARVKEIFSGSPTVKPSKPAKRHVPKSWRYYKQSSIHADKIVNKETSKAIGKKPQKPARQQPRHVQSSVATTPKSSTAESDSGSSENNLDKKILERAKQLRKERGKDEPPLP